MGKGLWLAGKARSDVGLKRPKVPLMRRRGSLIGTTATAVCSYLVRTVDPDRNVRGDDVVDACWAC